MHFPNILFWREKKRRGKGRPRKKTRTANILRSKMKRSPRTDEVLVFIGKGLANKEIADKMGIAENTVKNYVSQLMLEFDTQSRLQLVVKALKKGDLKIEEI